MRLKTLWIATLALLLGASLHAQDLAGDWQATLAVPSQPLRIIVRFKAAPEGGWTGAIYSIDQGNDWGAGTSIRSVTLEGQRLRLAVSAPRGTYEGTLAPDGKSIEGTWTQRQSLPLTLRRATPDTAWKDPVAHMIQFVTVDENVKLEVLDWGGSGPPLVFLAGLGNTAHVFDKFAPKFLAAHHVYGITRRGFGDSSEPPDGYAADRLADDVVAVLDVLKLSRPVLAGHSMAGEEMSSIASRHPERVSGLIYLDAAYRYAFYDAEHGNLDLDVLELRQKLERLVIGPPDSRPLIKELLETDLPRFERDLLAAKKEKDATPPALLGGPEPTNVPMQTRAIVYGMQKYTNFSSLPILAIYAVPHDPGPLFANDPALRAAQIAQDEATTSIQAAAFEKGVPSARVVRIPNANHYVFRSNEAEVLREMNSFLSSIK